MCQGYKKDVTSRLIIGNDRGISAIPGVVTIHPNHHVNTMKGPNWVQVLTLLGRDGEKVMVNLLVGCGIFAALESGNGNYHQLSGNYERVNQ